jgi:predicted HTH domain antitoxin
MYARDPSELAYCLLISLTAAGQLTLASAAKLSGIEEYKLQKFIEEENYGALTEKEQYQLCVALLITDKSINGNVK